MRREPMNLERSVIQNAGIQNLGHRFALNRFGLKSAAKLAGLALVLLPLPGCQSITGSPHLAQLRVVDASPDAPGLDVYQGGSALAYNLGLGTITSYVPTVPGNFTINVDAAGTKTPLVSSTGTFLPNAQYTVLVGNFAASLQELILKDQSVASPFGEVAVRIVDQSVKAGAVDIYLIPAGSNLASTAPLITNVTFNTNSGYMDIPAGTYSLVALPTGTTPSATSAALFSGAAVNYPGAAARTLILIDATVTTTPEIKVITAFDFDPDNEPAS